MTGLIEYIARALVDQPEQVQLHSTPAEGGTLYELKVSPEDVGKVIGRDGRTVNAIRTLLAAASQKKGEKARLEILDDRRSTQAAAASADTGDTVAVPAEGAPSDPELAE